MQLNKNQLEHLRAFFLALAKIATALSKNGFLSSSVAQTIIEIIQIATELIDWIIERPASPE